MSLDAVSAAEAILEHTPEAAAAAALMGGRVHISGAAFLTRIMTTSPQPREFIPLIHYGLVDMHPHPHPHTHTRTCTESQLSQEVCWEPH